MIIYPAIDILDGKCVRLRQGDYAQKTIYGDNPVEIAKKWENKGACFIHLVDLNAAKGEIKRENTAAIEEIRKSVKVKLQLGGGIRDFDSLERAFDCGVDRVVIGTKAVSDPFFVYCAARDYKEKIAVGLDARDDNVATSGWCSTHDLNVYDYAGFIEKIGVDTIVYTDISTDGMLQGINEHGVKKMLSAVKINIIASGGVSSIDDIKRLKSLGVSGAIIGKAIYTGKISLEEALNVS